MFENVIFLRVFETRTSRNHFKRSGYYMHVPSGLTSTPPLALTVYLTRSTWSLQQTAVMPLTLLIGWSFWREHSVFLWGTSCFCIKMCMELGVEM
jgi:hypothetical protein